MSCLAEIAHIADIPVDLRIELDRKTVSLRVILELKKGSVLKLQRSAGENIDLLLGDVLIGFGELVVIEDRMGVRITDFNCED